MFIHWDEVCDPNSSKAGLTEIIVAKQRNGPIGDVQLVSLIEYARFGNLEHDEH